MPEQSRPGVEQCVRARARDRRERRAQKRAPLSLLPSSTARPIPDGQPAQARLRARADRRVHRVPPRVGRQDDGGLRPEPRRQGAVQTAGERARGITRIARGLFSAAVASPARPSSPARAQVILCEDQQQTQHPSLVASMLAHELVHAYDQCRAKVRWNDCRHHACSEVRASNLSGECGFANEVARGHFAITSQQRACVRRRAMLSVGFNPHCSAVAKAAVEPMNDGRLHHDTAPFDDAVRSGNSGRPTNHPQSARSGRRRPRARRGGGPGARAPPLLLPPRRARARERRARAAGPSSDGGRSQSRSRPR